MKKDERKYPVLCAGCEKEGIRTVVNWSTVPNSHGACPRHVREMVARARERRRILDALEADPPSLTAAAKAMAVKELRRARS